MDRLTVAPFLLAFIVAVAAMPTNIYQVCAWHVGTLKLEPWRSRVSAIVARARTTLAWLTSIVCSRAFRLGAAMALLVASLADSQAAGVSMAIAPALAVDEWGTRLREAAESASSDAEVDELKADHGRWMKAQEARLREIEDQARAAGRDEKELLADEQRKVNAIAGRIGLVSLDVSNAIARRAQVVANRNRIGGAVPGAIDGPRDWKSVFPSMFEYKAQGVVSDAGGGYLVTATAGAFFDRLRPESVVLSAGPRIEPCDTDALELPGLSASSTVYQTGEHADITASDVTLQKVRIPMNKYAVFTVGSSEWFADAAHGPRQIIEMDHRNQLAARIDKDMLEGSGSAILGLRNALGVTKTALGSGDGAAPALGDVIDALERMERANAKASALFMHPRTWKVFRKLQDSQNRYQLQPDPTEDTRRSLFGVPVFLSSQISIAETLGGSSDCSYIIAADMRYVVVGKREDVFVLYDPFSYSKKDQIAVRSTTRWGLGVLHNAAVEVITGVRS